MNLTRVGSIKALQGPAPGVSLSQNASEFVAQGAAALERGDAEAAKALFQRALKIAPGNVAARTYLGLIADRAGELAEAERQFQAAVTAAPNSPEARNNYGAILMKLGRKRDAAREFEASLRLNPKQAGALINLAQIRFDSGQVQDLRSARDLFQRAWAIAPEAETARALVAVALRMGDRVAADTAYPNYLAALPQAPATVAGPAARAELGAALLEAGLYQPAISELRAAVESNPVEGDSSQPRNVVLLARACRNANDLPAAGRTLEQAVARGLEAASVYAELAEVYEATGHAEHAIPTMHRATELDPNNEAYHFRYAMLLTDTDAPQAAVVRLQEAFKIFPNSAPLWFAMGIAQFQNNQNDEASRAFERALQLNPKMWGALAYLGMIDVDRGQAAQAIDYYSRSLAIDERSPVTQYLIAEAYSKLSPSDNSEAEKHLKLALSCDPGFVQAHLALGKLYFRQNQLPEAAAELEQVVKSDPKLAEAYYQLGRVYVRQKRQKESADALEKFQQLSNEQKKQSEDSRRDIVRRLENVRF